METFGVDDIFTPPASGASARGAVVVNIAHIPPQALTRVMALNGIEPDFAAGRTCAQGLVATTSALGCRPSSTSRWSGGRTARYDAQIAELRNMWARCSCGRPCVTAPGPRTRTRTRRSPAFTASRCSIWPGSRSRPNFALPLVHEIAAPNDRALSGTRCSRPPRPRARRQCAEQRDGRGREHHRPEARRARARLHRCADRPVPPSPAWTPMRATRASPSSGSRSTTERARCSSRPRPTRTCALSIRRSARAARARSSSSSSRASARPCIATRCSPRSRRRLPGGR